MPLFGRLPGPSLLRQKRVYGKEMELYVVVWRTSRTFITSAEACLEQIDGIRCRCLGDY